MGKTHQKFFIKRTSLFFLFIVLFYFNGMFSQENTYRVSQEFSSLKTGVPYKVTDKEIDVPNHLSLRPKTFIKLKVKSDAAPFVSATTTVVLSIKAFNPNGITVGSSVAKTLVVSYNPNVGGANFIDLSYFEILNRYGAEVTIKTISTKNGTGNVTALANANVVLEIGFECERYYQLTQQLVAIQPTILTDLNEQAVTVDSALKLAWNPLKGATEYEVEWTWVDNYGDPASNGANQFLKPEVIPFSSKDFEKNCTRIKTKDVSYEIPLIYSDGYIIYRIRGVGRFMDDTKKYFYGDWSSGLSQKNFVSDWINHTVLVQAHENNKNWQFQSSYAEEGKKKEVISYFDGSLRNRQTVTKVNTDKNAVVGEVVYDTQGRAAIEVLPVPLFNKNYIRYFSDLNKNLNGVVYSHKDFDWDTVGSACNVSSAGMNRDFGSSHYYSNQNEFTSVNTNFIPDAFKYPFSQVEYTPDNTGRIKRKGGVGETHQLGSGHEMKYYYTNPYQPELNRLFGYDVGYENHYKKNITVDPNGQVSVSYIDPQGRTIATALSGKAPDSMVALHDETSGDHTTITVDLLNNNNPDHLDTPQDNTVLGSTTNFSTLNDKLTLSREIVVVGNDVKHDFNYTIKNDNSFLPERCDERYEFVYDLKLSLKDECSAEKFDPFSGNTTPETAYIRKIGTPYIGPSPGTINPEINIPFTNILNTGTHSLVKELKVNQDALNYYADEYIKKIKDKSSGVNCYLDPKTFAPASSLSDCFTSCDECNTSIGTEAVFVTKQLISQYNNPSFVFAASSDDAASFTDSLIDINGEDSITISEVKGYIVQFKNEWKKLKNSCDLICQPSFASSCSFNEESLLKDISPKGQYGGELVQTNANKEDPNNLITVPTYEVTDVLSVFNSTNTGALYYNDGITADVTKNDWRNPVTPYRDELGNESFVYVELVSTSPDLVYDPKILPNAVIKEEVINNITLYKVSPQDLLKVSDFLTTFWKPSWAQSLLPYHPEYCYLEYSKELCTKTKEVTILNTPTSALNDSAKRGLTTDEYDGYLDYLDTYQGAENAGLFGSATDANALFNSDPYFSNDLTLKFETTDLFALRKDIMTSALTNYENHGDTMLQEAYKTILCNAITICDTKDFLFSNLNPEQRDKLWNSYKILYKSLKSKIKYVFMNVYAIKNGCYNGCIGTDAPSTITNVISNYTVQTTKIFTYIQSNRSQSQLCTSSSAINYQTKVKKFAPIDSGYKSGVDPNVTITGLAAQSKYQIYAETGVCPPLFDLELFLDGYFKSPPSNLNNSSQPIDQNLTLDLFNGFTGANVTPMLQSSYPSSANVDSILSDNKTITFSFSGSGFTAQTNAQTPIKPLVLKIANTGTAAGLNWSNYGSFWKISDFKQFYYNPTTSSLSNLSALNFGFNVIAVISVNGTTKEIVLSGTTSAKIGECGISEGVKGQVLDYNTATNDDMAGCAIKYKFKEAFVRFLNQLHDTNKLFLASEVPLNSVPTYTQTFLNTFFKESATVTSTWKYDGTTFSINRGADVLFTMQITLPVSGFYQFEGITIDSKNQRLFTLYYTDANGQIQNVTGSFNEQIDFSCCGYQKNIVPVFCLRKQISRGFVSGDPNLNGKLFYSDRIFTPKNISIPQQQGFTMEFSVDKRDKGADPFTMSDWQPEIKIDSNPYDVYFEQLTNGVNAYAYVHYPPKNRLSWNGYYGARYDITRLEYNINGNEKVFEFKERAGTFTKSTDGTGSLSMNITSNSSIWNPTGGLSLNTTNETYWDNTDPGFILDFNQKTKLTFKATLKFTGDLPYYNGLKGGKEGYFGHIAQLDYQDPIKGDLYQLLVYGKNQTAELCTTCIPQTVAPVVCDEKYATYLAFLNFNSVGVSTRFPAVSREDVEEEEEFCRKNLGYLVDSYIVYCKNATINITSTESPRYLTLTQFGVTNLNYGYTKINDAITAYATYLSSPVGPDPKYPDDEPLVHLGWGEYVDTKYITDNKICAPPAPMLVNSLEIMAGPSPCEQMNITLSETYQDDAYNAYLGVLRERFIAQYIKKAMGTVAEQFTMTYLDKEYHYTLYYYDQAGNLIKTVAPQGVNRITPAKNGEINAFRISPSVAENLSLLPDNTFKTEYKYNSLNQLVWQSTPDGGITTFAYDKLGRIIASQNAKQKVYTTPTGNPAAPTSQFSYTNYDYLGRITEAGQVSVLVSANYSISNEGRLMVNDTMVDGFSAFVSKNEVTKTIYTEDPMVDATLKASNLFTTNAALGFNPNDKNRNRVTGIYYFDNYIESTPPIFDNAIFYNYDIHGNVKEVVNYNSYLKKIGCNSKPASGQTIDCEKHIKRVVYDYDLISGNVNKVTFQPSREGEIAKKDLFIHKYEYDADNRIVNVQTSSDGVIWEKDANYKYYPHGPLARTELGDKKVQGIDYAYTLQGWLKTVNGENLQSRDNDMGRDGIDTTINKDAFGYSLSYYDEQKDAAGGLLSHSDYQQIRNENAGVLMYSKNSAIQPGSSNLYNGNIKKMVTAMRTGQDDMLPVQVNKYAYDQLNRINSMTSSSVNSTNESVKDSYGSNYSYDKNGNLMTLTRSAPKADGTIAEMDKLTYDYVSGANRLTLVDDATKTPSTAFVNDLENQTAQLLALGIIYNKNDAGTHNYVYDEIGQLIADKTEGLKIEWRVDGKVKKVSNLKSKTIITFEYDGLGNRIAKKVVEGSAPLNAATSYYARDAQGNELAVYKLNETTTGNVQKKDFVLKEHHIFGSSRLGLEEKNILIDSYDASKSTLKMMANLTPTASPGAVATVVVPVINDFAGNTTSSISARMAAIVPLPVVKDYSLSFVNGNNAKWPMELSGDTPLTDLVLNHLTFNTSVKLVTPPTNVGNYLIGQLQYSGKTVFPEDPVTISSMSPFSTCISTTTNSDKGLEIARFGTCAGVITKTLPAALPANQNGYLEYKLNTADIDKLSNNVSVGFISGVNFYGFKTDVTDAFTTISSVVGTVKAILATLPTNTVADSVLKIERTQTGLMLSYPNPAVTNGKGTYAINVPSMIKGYPLNLAVTFLTNKTSIRELKVVKTLAKETTTQAVVALAKSTSGVTPKVVVTQYVKDKFSNVATKRTFTAASNNTLSNSEIANVMSLKFDTDFDKTTSLLVNGVSSVTDLPKWSATSPYTLVVPTVSNIKDTNQLGGSVSGFNAISFETCGIDYSLNNAISHKFSFDDIANKTPTEANNTSIYMTVTPPGVVRKLGPCLLDQDADGIYDIYEVEFDANSVITYTDTDSDQIPNYLDNDDDGDGVLTLFEGADRDGDHDPTTGKIPPLNTDNTIVPNGDAIPDYLDADDDGDGVLTKFEGANPDGDGNPTAGKIPSLDTDGNQILNYLDPDDDADGVYTFFEGADPDGDHDPRSGATLNTDKYTGVNSTFIVDNIPNYLDVDDDGDGIFTKFEGANLDGDRDPTTGKIPPLNTNKQDNVEGANVKNDIPNYLDSDDDGDGYATLEFAESGTYTPDGSAYKLDSDNDRIMNYLDPKGNSYPTAINAVLSDYYNTTGDKRYELANHLGNVLVVVRDNKIPKLDGSGNFAGYFNSDVLSYSDYYPFGQLVPNRHGSSDGYRYGFNGMEKDDELKGESNSYDFGARMLDPRVGRWFARDPLESKYPSLSGYNFAANNPIIYYDFDGRDIVYFNRDGKEQFRILTDKVFKTYVESKVSTASNTSFLYFLTAKWDEAPMPNIIQTRMGEDGKTSDVSSEKYQRFDYIIAAETYLFNDNKNSDLVPSRNGEILPNASEKVSDLDPTLVKAIIMQETAIGKDYNSKDRNDSTKDIMQANVYYSANSNDWNPSKTQFGLTKDGGAEPQQSIRAGIGLLYFKGLKNIDGSEQWRGGADWGNAVKSYNGSSKYLEYFKKMRKEFYKDNVFKMKDESVPKTNP